MYRASYCRYWLYAISILLRQYGTLASDLYKLVRQFRSHANLLNFLKCSRRKAGPLESEHAIYELPAHLTKEKCESNLLVMGLRHLSIACVGKDVVKPAKVDLDVGATFYIQHRTEKLFEKLMQPHCQQKGPISNNLPVDRKIVDVTHIL